jgi:hypothetical protein
MDSLILKQSHFQPHAIATWEFEDFDGGLLTLDY